MTEPTRRASEGPTSTKTRILQAAEEVFAQKGFDGASTREIASRAAVNISSLHYHWESKETLYVAVFERVYQELFERLREDFARPATEADARAVISRALGKVFDLFADSPNTPRLLLRQIMDSNGGGRVPEREVMGPGWNVFADWARTFTSGRLSSEDVAFLMLAVQSTLLVVMLDSPHVASLIGGSVTERTVRERLRGQVITLVETLVGVR